MCTEAVAERGERGARKGEGDLRTAWEEDEAVESNRELSDVGP